MTFLDDDISVAAMVESLLFQAGGSEDWLSDTGNRVPRDSAFGLINRVENSARWHLGSAPGRVGLSAVHSVETLVALLGLALSGAEIFLLAPDLEGQQLDEIRRRWGLNAVLESRALFSDSGVRQVKQTKSLVDREISLDAPFFSVLSSGTTDTSKVITHSFRSAFGSATAFQNLLGDSGLSCWYHNWPMHYMAGIFNLFLCPLIAGAQIHVGRAYSAAITRSQLEEIHRLNPSHLLVSPTMAHAFASLARVQGTSLTGKCIVSTSSMLYPSVKHRFFERFGARLRPCYGITEFGGSFTLGDEDSLDFSVGRAVAGVKLQIRDEEVWVKTPYVAQRIERSDGSEIVLDPEEFHPTSDLGQIDPDGQLVLRGRRGELLKKGGEFISLIDVENSVLGVSEVGEVLAIPHSSDFWGQDFALKVVPRLVTATPMDELRDKIREKIREDLSARGLPSEIEFVESIVRTSSGKPLRRFYYG